MNKQRSILILGGGVMQLPAIRAAHRLGLYVIVADGNENAPGRPEADQFEHVDLRESELMLEVARKHHDSGRLDAVFTAGTDFSSTVAFVADGIGLPGTSLESALNATDKFRMRRVLKDAGVCVPRFTVLGEAELTSDGVEAALGGVGLPAVVKPADSMGARGVVRVESAGSALEMARLAVAHSQTRRVVLEGYIDGPEFSIDALVYRGTVQITGFADRHISFAPYFIEMGHTIPTNLDARSQSIIVDEFKRGVAALGISDGAAKGDMKLSPDGPVVGEIAARLSGGYMSGWTFPLSSGVELTEKAIRISLGEPPGSLHPAWDRTSAERAVISIPGAVEEITGTGNVENRADVSQLFLTVSPGDEVRLPTSNVEKCGNVISVAATRAGAQAAAEAAVADIEVVLRPGEMSTAAYLFDNAGGYWAYPVSAKDAAWRAGIGIRESAQHLEEFGTNADWDLPGLAAGPVGIGKLPAIASQSDWSHRSLQLTVERLEQDGLIRTDRLDPRVAPLVWRGILRGGIQGGRFVIRSLFEYASE